MSTDLDTLFQSHLDELRRRTDAALAKHGFDGLAIYSGSAGYAFLDDHAYPFRANPHFKHWVPLTDVQHSFVCYAPGARTAAAVPPAGGLLAQAAHVACGSVGAGFSPRGVAQSRRGTRPARARWTPHRIHRGVAAGIRGLGFRCGESRRPAGSAALRPGGEDSVRARVHATGLADGGTGSRRRAGRVPVRRIGVRDPPRLLQRPSGSATRNCRTATSSRSTRTPRCCTTSTWGASAAARAARS